MDNKSQCLFCDSIVKYSGTGPLHQVFIKRMSIQTLRYRWA